VLSPNARVHWAAKNRAVKLYRENCAWLTKAAGLKADWDGFVHAAITFYPPDRRHRDQDNMVASSKALFDGVADALGINDRRFRIHPVISDDTRPGGAVLVELFRRIEDMA
jgi:Holliday junction resolvase RusA-like endonuclease